MSEIDKAYIEITAVARGRRQLSWAPAMLIVTVIYLAAVLSIPLYSPQRLIWLAAYPIIASEITGAGFGRIFIKSLWILPLVAFIGIFDPFVDKAVAFTVHGVAVSRGWVSFFSILLRGLLSFQAVLILVSATGFIDIFNSLRKLGLPEVLTTQLMLTYRYISVILEEAIIMKRAREARGFGRKSYPLTMWGRFIGQLLLRSMNRAANIHRCMKARGFDGSLPTGNRISWNKSCWLWLLVWTALIAALRFVDFSSFFLKIL